MGRDKKEKKDKKDRKDKKRKREKDLSEDDDYDQRQHRRLEKEAERVAKALRKGSSEAYEDEHGQLQTGRFVWQKKIESDLQKGARSRDIYNKQRQNTEEERRAEMEKIQKRKEDREREREERELEQDMLQRSRMAAETQELEKKEEEFHLENAKARALQRLKDGREKPIDLLVRDLLLWNSFDVGEEPPYEAFNGLTLIDIQDVREDLLEYQELDSADKEHAAWWTALLTVCDEEVKSAESRHQKDRARLRGQTLNPEHRGREVGVHEAVDSQIEELLAGQTYSELLTMERNLEEELDSGIAPDPEFHSAILRRMVLHKAKAQLREIHGSLRNRRANRRSGDADIATQMGWRGEYAERAKAQTPEADRPSSDDESLQNGASPSRALPPIAVQSNGNEDNVSDYGQWSPLPLDPEEFAGKEVVDEEEDWRLVSSARQQALQLSAANFGAATLAPAQGSGEFTNPTPMLPSRRPSAPQGDDLATRKLKAQAANAMGDLNEAGDAPFGGEVQDVESKVYWWHEKYRPRKPKYYNRVHTGYEWNKYNQTHYDHDNPPPKVVQGYKFNIFYPDLVDKKQTPSYEVLPDPEADQFGGTCLLRFSAGPPYEDLTFRILSREWEYSHKKGFKSVFDRDTLYLYFNFQRQRYRR